MTYHTLADSQQAMQNAVSPCIPFFVPLTYNLAVVQCSDFPEFLRCLQISDAPNASFVTWFVSEKWGSQWLIGWSNQRPCLPERILCMPWEYFKMLCPNTPSMSLLLKPRSAFDYRAHPAHPWCPHRCLSQLYHGGGKSIICHKWFHSSAHPPAEGVILLIHLYKTTIMTNVLWYNFHSSVSTHFLPYFFKGKKKEDWQWALLIPQYTRNTVKA